MSIIVLEIHGIQTLREAEDISLKLENLMDTGTDVRVFKRDDDGGQMKVPFAPHFGKRERINFRRKS